MPSEEELKEEIEDLEYYQKRIEEIRGTSVFIINKKEMTELQEELTECERSFSFEKLESLKAQLKTLQERNTEVKQVIKKWFPNLKKEKDRALFLKLKRELLQKLGLGEEK